MASTTKAATTARKKNGARNSNIRQQHTVFVLYTLFDFIVHFSCYIHELAFPFPILDEVNNFSRFCSPCLSLFLSLPLPLTMFLSLSHFVSFGGRKSTYWVFTESIQFSTNDRHLIIECGKKVKKWFPLNKIVERLIATGHMNGVFSLFVNWNSEPLANWFFLKLLSLIWCDGNLNNFSRDDSDRQLSNL